MQSHASCTMHDVRIKSQQLNFRYCSVLFKKQESIWWIYNYFSTNSVHCDNKNVFKPLERRLISIIFVTIDISSDSGQASLNRNRSIYFVFEMNPSPIPNEWVLLDTHIRLWRTCYLHFVPNEVQFIVAAAVLVWNPWTTLSFLE